MRWPPTNGDVERARLAALRVVETWEARADFKCVWDLLPSEERADLITLWQDIILVEP